MLEPLVSLDDFIDSALGELSGASIRGFSLHDGKTLARVAFYGSLEAEEGRPCTFSLALVDEFLVSFGANGHTWRPIIFREQLDLTVSNLAKLAGAADLRYAHIAVQRTGSALKIIGLIRRNSQEFKQSRGEATAVSKFRENFLVVNATAAGRIDLRVNSALVGSFHRGSRVPKGINLFGESWLSSELSVAAAIAQLPLFPYLVALRGILNQLAERRVGGTLLLVSNSHLSDLELTHSPSAGACAIQDALHHVGSCEVGPRDEVVAAAELQSLRPDRRLTEAADFLRDITSFCADLASVDGAVVLERSLSIVGFGCKITCQEPIAVPARLALNEDGTQSADAPLASLGTRHNSAARFCFNHTGTIGFVASQDGVVSCMHRPSGSEVLLVWRPLALEWTWGFTREGGELGEPGPEP